MSRHYNTRHDDRNKSNYPERLNHRGLSKAPAMEELEVLERRQDRRVRDTCTLVHEHDTIDCNGFPWWQGNDVHGPEPTPEERLLNEIFRA